MMSRRVSRLEVVSVGLVVLTALLGVALWPSLPPRVAIHFSASGDPGNYVPRLVAIVAMPVIMVLTIAVLNGAARIDPPTSDYSIDVIICSTMCLLAIVHAFTLGRAVGYRIPIAVVLGTVAVWSLFVVGYSLVAEGHLS
jgi:uncharacterized membrane protein